MKLIMKMNKIHAYSYSDDHANLFITQRRISGIYTLKDVDDIPFRYKDDRFELIDLNGLIVVGDEIEVLYDILEEHQKLIGRLNYITQYLHIPVDTSFLEAYELPDDKTNVIDSILEIYNLSTIISILERRIV